MTPQERILPLADVPILIEAELDRKTMSVAQILRLRPGSVIKLNRSAGENIDIRMGSRLVAFGEIVVLEETLGVRITDFNDNG